MNPTGPIHWRKYGEATVIPLSLTSLADSSTVLWAGGFWTPSTGDVKLATWDSGSEFSSSVNTTNLPAGATNGSPLWFLSLTASEMSHKQIAVTIKDDFDSLIAAQSIPIVTFGHVDAMYPFDLSSPTNGVTIAPIQANVVSSLLVDTDVTIYKGSEAPSLMWTVLDANNVPVDLSSATLSFKVFTTSGTTVFTKTSGSGISVSGSSSNIVTVAYTATDTATAGGYLYSLWRTDGSDTIYATGKFVIKPVVK